MTPDIFLKLDKIKGESKDAKHSGEIDVESFSFGVSNGASFSVGGGGGAGRASFQDLTITKLADTATPLLVKACTTGEHIVKGLLTVRKAGGEQREYYKIELKDIIVTGVTNTGANGGVPTELISLSFAEMKLVYKEQTEDGSLGGVTEFGWNVKKNQPV